jgi:hypothetical protein
MARVTITNTQTSRYLVPTPIRQFVGAGQTAVFDGISVPAMEASLAFVAAVADGTITVAVSQDPAVPDALEAGSMSSADFGTLLTPMRTIEWTNPATADVDALKLSIASATTIQTYTGADLDGAVGLGTMSPPRNVTITTTLSADIDAVAVVITGLDVDGAALTDTITLTDGGNTTDVGTAAFASVSSIVVPAQSGTGGALEFGFGDLIGLPAPIRTRAGLAAVHLEIEAGSAVTTGTFVDGATGAPHGTYLAANVPNATRDYAVTYELAASAYS